VRRELGVLVHDPMPIPMPVPMTFKDPTLDVHTFLVTRWDGGPVNTAPEEHNDLRWFSPAEVARLKLADPAALSSILSAVEIATE